MGIFFLHVPESNMKTNHTLTVNLHETFLAPFKKKILTFSNYEQTNLILDSGEHRDGQQQLPAPWQLNSRRSY